MLRRNYRTGLSERRGRGTQTSWDSDQGPLRRGPVWIGVLAASLILFTAAAATANHDDDDDDRGVARAGSPQTLRGFIGDQVGGLDKLRVPANNADLPQPRGPEGQPIPRYQTTEAKRYLGKQLFHDPVRSVRIVDSFGGELETRSTSSCGSCHFGRAGTKAGTVLNFASGGEGVGYTDATGKFVPRRRARTDLLPPLRQTPLFPGDALVDALPTLTDIYVNAQGVVTIGSPALGQLNVGDLQATGRLDAVDSVGRMAPSMVGAAFNNRLLLDGFAGEDDATDGGLNPFGDPAQENLTLLLLDAHRMLALAPPQPTDGVTQSSALLQIPAFVKLFRDAFPEEAAAADLAGDMNLLINDVTIFRATATYLRTVVTRNTPWDRYLAGNNRALTRAQRRGAKLFFTPATSGGAGCYSCHSGPMFNKQANDPDVAGVGAFVEQNFHNLGLGDHPVQALNRAARNDPNFRDFGRQEITGRAEDAFKFRTLTLRQLKNAGVFMHDASFTRIRDVVEYFNAGIPQDARAGAPSIVSTRFTNPRGPGSARGLGLSVREVEDLTDFIENGLFDPALEQFDPQSTTDAFQLHARDTTYSVYRPDLAALGATDGFPLSGLAQDNNDPLSRRDQGLEFLDVTHQVDATRTARQRWGRHQNDTYRIRNTSPTVVDTHLLIVVEGLPSGADLLNASGTTSGGDPYIRLFLDDGVLSPGQDLSTRLQLRGRPGGGAVSYHLTLLSGQGVP